MIIWDNNLMAIADKDSAVDWKWLMTIWDEYLLEIADSNSAIY